MKMCAVAGCTRPVPEKLLSERVTVDDRFLDLCEYHAVGHKKRFKRRPLHGTKLFIVSVPTGHAWLVRSTSKLRAQKMATERAERGLKELVLSKQAYVRVVNPDNIQTGVLMVGSAV